MAQVKLHTQQWSMQRRTARSKGRRSVDSSEPGLPAEFVVEGASTEEFDVQPRAAVRRGGAGAEPLDFSYELADGEAAVVAIRMPSGALSFHLPMETTRRGVGRSGAARFRIDVRTTEPESGRRGLVSTAVKAILVKFGKAVLDRLASATLPRLVAAFEKASFAKRKIPLGWLKVDRASLRSGALLPRTPKSSERSLLFLHGTFSNASSAFRGLAASNFFESVSASYGDRIFAFNHFSLSLSPEQNARMLLESLPDGRFQFDVITHSRGGLVLRNLVERSSEFGALAKRFSLGRAVLVAAPNEGTPLATPRRVRETVGWIANLIEMFPDNPLTFGAEFIANALVWLAKHAAGDLPGLASMDADAEQITTLQQPPGPPSSAYSALVANYHPTGNLLKRVVDMGVDQFFGSANDLVVPSEGGWRIDLDAGTLVPSARIGCFGPGGNLPSESVNHLNLFEQPETAEFLIAALGGRPHALPALDPRAALPDRRAFRSLAAAPLAIAPRASLAAASAPRAAPASEPLRTGPRLVTVNGSTIVASDTLHLIILRGSARGAEAQILAQYGSARVLAPLRLSGERDRAGERWKEINDRNHAIRAYIDDGQGEMPSDAQLRRFGVLLFETLLPGSVRRLYDTVRSLQRSERLNVILTAMHPEFPDKPWEFAFDAVRKTSLATEEIHFIRNVVTAVPAEFIDDRQRLRILIVSSQPVGLGKLSVEEEAAVIQRGFEPLREAGLADIEVLPRATPASLHERVSTGRFSVVHFIGHGEYDAAKGKGFLVFQDEQQNAYSIDDRSTREILCGRGIRLVFLNACETGTGGHADFNRGVAPALVAGGVPMVVANQYKVLDTSATLFAQHFYWSLANGASVAEAAREARIAVNYSMSGDTIDWAVPVVYARDPNSRLSAHAAAGRRSTFHALMRPSDRRRTAQHRVRVAVWDTHSQFPQLSATLERMNTAQTYYGFEMVDLTVPLDAWHNVKSGRAKREQKRIAAGPEQRYLDANRFAERLAPQIPQLGVHYICAIIDEPMLEHRTDGRLHYNIYGFWSHRHQPPVLVFSTHGLSLDAAGPTTDRVIANVAATGLASQLLDEDLHQSGDPKCPRFYNDARDLTLLSNPQKFCSRCVAKLRKKHAEQHEALTALLRAFARSSAHKRSA